MYLTKENIVQRWWESKRHTDRLTDRFPEYQRIARNEPYPGGDPDYPEVTDGTTASIIQKTPKRVVQQLPTGVVKCDDEQYEWLCHVAEFIYLNKILPFANDGYDLFEKAQLVIENGLTFGNSASYTPFVNKDGTFTTDMTIPYWGDIYVPKGITSAKNSPYLFLRTWWQPEDIDELIATEARLAKQAKERGETYESTWDVEALQAIKKATDAKDKQGQAPHEDQLGTEKDAIEMVTGLQKGVKAPFFTFNPSTKTIVRTKINKDPRGKMPVDWFFGDIDGTNPLGRSIVDMIGPLQNLIDSDMQAYQYNRALALQPPVVKYGNIGAFKYAPNAVIDAADDPNAKIVPLTVDTSALTNYPQLYGLQKSQLLNLVASPDTSISADVGNPGFSKTPAGINQQQASISVDDNTIRKRWEAWFESWSETAINLYFAERTGVEVLTLDEETAAKLRKCAEEGEFDETLLNDQNQIIIDYDTATPVLHFHVDASTSKMADNKTQLESTKMLIESLDGSAVLQGIIPQENVLALWNKVVTLSGVEDPEEVQVDLKEFQQQQEEAMMQQQAAQEQQAMAAQEQQPQLSEQDQALIQNLQQLGAPDEVIQKVIDDLNNGIPLQEVQQKLEGVVNG